MQNFVKNRVEFSWRALVLSIVLTLILAMSNAYLALKLGILTSASIPAAMISMGVLRLFKNPSVLEHNAVQTAASAGEAIAGGIVYTIPALIITGYWQEFDYLTNVLIAASGGILGVLFSIPLRRFLVNDPHLPFPEGKAIASVLMSSDQQIGIKDIAFGAVFGALLEFSQAALKCLASGWTHFFTIRRSLFCVGLGFSATMIAAGYLIGFDLACSIGSGAVLTWLAALPIVSKLYPSLMNVAEPTLAGASIWNQKLRYFGIGGMLSAGAWTLMSLLKPLLRSIRGSLFQRTAKPKLNARERDLPFGVLVLGTLLVTVILAFLLNRILPLDQLGFGQSSGVLLLFVALGYILIMGFIFSVITAYFSGMVGVTASPGSSVVIAGILFAAWGLLTLMSSQIHLPFSPKQIAAAQAVVIILASVVTGIAAIANDNSQDLKVGQMLGATPWIQELMLLLGVLVSALVIPLVMQMMFRVYGIAGVMPHAGMDPAQSLPAPTAAMLAGLTSAVFSEGIPWPMMMGGGMTILILIVLRKLGNLDRYFKLSLLGVAIGMYLPMTSSLALFLGGCICKCAEFLVDHRRLSSALSRKQIGMRIGCGLVAGAALMDVFLAIPFSLNHNPDIWRILSPFYEQSFGVFASIAAIFGLGFWIIKRMTGAES